MTQNKRPPWHLLFSQFKPRKGTSPEERAVPPVLKSWQWGWWQTCPRVLVSWLWLPALSSQA